MTTESNDLNRSESESDISAIDFSLGCKRVSGPTRRSTKGGWTSEEDELLTNAVKMYKGHTSWKNIVELVPGLKDKRSEVQCQHRWLKVLDPNLYKGHWTKDEDDLLSKLVKDHMKNDRPQWSKISKQLSGRIGKQCRERWHNHLNPTIKKTAWTREEELILVQSQREHGNKWAEIAKLLPGRTENNIKNHWNCSVKKRLEQFPSNLSSGSRPSGFEYNFFNQKILQIEEAAAKSPLRDSLELTLGPTNWRSTPSSTSSLRGDESISSSVESDWSSLNVSESTQETPQSSNDNECIQEVKEIKKRLRMAASTFNTPSIISKRSSPALKRHRQNELNTPFQIDGGSHMPSEEEEHSTSPFSKYRLAKRNTCSGSKPLERRLDFDFM
ncbi:PREDICTED: myb-related protein B-like isoform X1 [Camelina sativa]|uniref:Myb-related protein B-like isoform X1 n=1 Tax=Camelina sativa TaxID=90675 RepID=A0ABM0TJ42_CAMSA|nr:PREDICTED: myb-related protein B-like isoform X1 [Camelina sativa]